MKTEYGYILTLDGIPIRAIPLRFNKYRQKWVIDKNVNRVTIYKTEHNAEQSKQDLIRSYKWFIEDKYKLDSFEFDATKVQVNKVSLVIERN